MEECRRILSTGLTDFPDGFARLPEDFALRRSDRPVGMVLRCFDPKAAILPGFQVDRVAVKAEITDLQAWPTLGKSRLKDCAIDARIPAQESVDEDRRD